MMKERTSQLLSFFLAVVLLVETVAPAFAAPPSSPPMQGGATSISPSNIEVTLAAGQSTNQKVSIRTAPVPIPKADVLFLFDVTGSMRSVLESAKANATYIMNTVKAKVGDLAFGVGSLSDYPAYYNYGGYSADYGAPGDYPWQLDQEITPDTGAVQAAISRLNLMNGKDDPEDYSRALFESMLIKWRPGTKKIVMLFADSVAHDTTFYGRNFGVDPGPDSRAGTEDDLVLTNVVDRLKEQRIEVIPINSDQKRTENVAKGFRYMAEQTGGQMFFLDDAKQVPEVVTRGLVGTTSKIGKLEITPDYAYAPWLAKIDPTAFTNVGGGETRTFTVTLAVPRETKAGKYSLNLIVSGDAATLGLVKVTITVANPITKFDIAKLDSEKNELIRKMSSGPTTYRPIEIATLIGLIFDKWTLLTYAEQEARVKPWVDSLVSKGNKAQPEEGVALQRLVWQEGVLYELYNAQARTTSVVGDHAGNLFALAFGTVSFLNSLDKLLDKMFRGGLVIKIKKALLDRMFDATSHLISMILSTAPKGSSLRRIDEIQQRAADGIHVYLQNNKSNTGKALVELLAKGVVQWAVKASLLNDYVARTQPLVGRGLQQARGIAASSVDPTLASERAKQAEARLVNAVNRVNADVGGLELFDKEIQAKQEYAKIVTNTAEAATLLATATGVGNTISGLLKLLAIVSRLIDGTMSLNVISNAGVQSEEIHSAAIRATDEAFAKGDVYTVADERSLDETTRTFPSSVVLPPNMGVALADLLQRTDDYKSVLRELATALRVKDRSQVELLLEKLVEIDDRLAQQTTVARAPIYAGASQLIRKPEYAESFVSLGRSSAHFDLADMAVYLTVIRATDNLEDSGNLQAALDQIEQAIVALERENRSIQDLLPVVPPTAQQPFLVVAGYSVPTLAMPSQDTQLTARIYNGGATTATGVTVEIALPKNLQSLSSTQIPLGDLPGGRDSQVAFQLHWLKDNQAIIRITPLLSNGDSLPTTIVISRLDEGIGTATAPRYLPIPTSQGDLGGYLLLILLSLLTIGALGTAGVLMVTSSRGTAVLVVIQGQASRPRIHLSRGVTTLGHDRHNDLVLPFDTEASRYHAEIRREPEGYVLYDLHSRNGTFVNDQPVSRHVLRDSDRIRIGKSILIVQSPRRS